MSLETKKEYILQCMDLGMDFLKACLCSDCTEEEIETLENDSSFQRDIDIKIAISEKNLLRKHNTALEIAKTKGNATPIQWRLSKLNPDKYENKNPLELKGFLGVANFDVELDEEDNEKYKKRLKDVFGEDFVE